MMDAIEMVKPVVLAVDDAPQYLSMLGAMLQPAYNVRLASSGRRALQLAALEPRPDVVILDVVMPEMDGHQVLAALRADAATRGIPVIFMTSLQEISQELAGLAEGAVDYIVKPAVPEVLRARVSTQIEVKRLRDKLQERNDALECEIERREALESSLRQTLADLEAFSYIVSQDLRAPLATISGFAQSVRETEAACLSEKGRHRLGRIVAGAEKMGSMIDDILTYSRTNNAQLTPTQVNLSTMLAEVAREAGEAYPTATLEIGPLPEVRGDATMLRQVFTNLVANAFKFSRGNPAAHVRIGANACANGHEIFVADNGAGFDMGYADKLFGLFQRLHKQDEFPGSGVGLAIVRRLLHRHGGEVRAKSAPGVCTMFTVSLPA